MRGLSTAVDAVVFLLLVSAAVGTLVVAGPSASRGPTDGTAAATARTLTTSTLAVEYSPMVGRNRTATGTAAGLLAESTLATARLGHDRLTPTGDTLADAVRDAVEPVARHRSAKVQVRAVWAAYRGAPLDGETDIGPTPPAGTDVDAATVTVPSGLSAGRDAALEAAERDGYLGVARVVADSYVGGRFDAERMRLALYGEGDRSDLAAARYHGAARTLGVSVDRLVTRAATESVNRRLTAALADRLRRDLRSRFDTPEDAARAVTIGEVRIIIRTWSP